MTDTQILLLLAPVILIEIGLIIYAVRDLVRPERTVRGESKLMWGLIICLISLVGPILYLTVGRREE
ncbi:MAG: PLD nuclease N-terminal domain-containing protein [Chloroflexota bacterium]